MRRERRNTHGGRWRAPRRQAGTQGRPYPRANIEARDLARFIQSCAGVARAARDAAVALRLFADDTGAVEWGKLFEAAARPARIPAPVALFRAWDDERGRIVAQVAK